MESETDDGTKPFIAIAMLVCGVIGGLMLVILCLIFCKQCFKPQQDSKLNENRCYYRTCYSEKSSPAKRSRLNNRLFEYATESQSRKSKGNEQQYKNKPCSGNLMVIETSRNVAVSDSRNFVRKENPVLKSISKLPIQIIKRQLKKRRLKFCSNTAMNLIIFNADKHCIPLSQD
ncbi:Small ribosomal subunit protein [Trichinella spiralis]|uniref:Small ribosomal subunit protein n=1 Tax=Trichinella spiralis TaxID=6334 RepID=A0ABR3KI22_TRISP